MEIVSAVIDEFMQQLVAYVDKQLALVPNRFQHTDRRGLWSFTSMVESDYWQNLSIAGQGEKQTQYHI
jgi:hypothetical protein